MSNLALVTDNMLPVANETFIDNLSAGISAGAAIVPINSLSEYSDGDSVVLTVDPGTASQATFIGEKQGNTVIDCKWTEGNVGASHAAGATVIDYDSSTHYNVLTKVLRMTHNETGSLKTTAVQAALNISSAVPADWTVLATAPTLQSSNGQREYVLKYTGVDYTDRLQPGTKLKIPRTVAAQTQSTSLNGTNQYWSKSSPAGMTFTNNFVVGAWVKLSSYAATNMDIVSRYNGTSGWVLRVSSAGQVQLVGINGGATNYMEFKSYQSIPLNKWVHIAAQMDMTVTTNTPTTNYIMIDGVDVPLVATRGGTSPTSLVQAGNLEIGSANGGTELFPGKIQNAFVTSAKLTQTQVRAFKDQKLTTAIATTYSMVAAYPFDGNGNDVSSNANNLTGSGGAVATDTDTAFSTDVFGIATKVTLSGSDTLVTVFCPTGAGIPNETLGTTSYSSVRAPYGFPASRDRWNVELLLLSIVSASGGVIGTVYNPGGLNISAPTGDWRLLAQIQTQQISSSGMIDYYISISTSSSVFNIRDLVAREYVTPLSGAGTRLTTTRFDKFISSSAITPYYLLLSPQQTSANLSLRGFYGTNVGEFTQVTLECAYL